MGKKGKLFVISAPSGSGKTTLCRRLIPSAPGKHRKLLRSISVTTRNRRKGERHGKDYFFVSRREFLKKRRKREFLEWARVLGNFYGTRREFVQKHINRGEDVLLSIDVQGARKIKRKFNRAVFIFILPPSLRELERRLRRRSTEDHKEITRRLGLAKEEMGFIKEYDYVIVNAKISTALKRLREIVDLERRK